MPAKYPLQYCNHCNKTFTKPHRNRHQHHKSTAKPQKIVKEQQQKCPCCLEPQTKSNLARHVLRCKENMQKIQLKQLRSKSLEKTTITIGSSRLISNEIEVHAEKEIFGTGKQHLLNLRGKKNLDPIAEQDFQSGSDTIQNGIERNKASLFQAIQIRKRNKTLVNFDGNDKTIKTSPRSLIKNLIFQTF